MAALYIRICFLFLFILMKKHAVALALLAAVCMPVTGNAGKKNDPVVISIAGEDVRLSEFQYLYNKNAEQQAEPVSLDEYVKMFVNYKLKVRAARDARVDTLASFVKDYNQFQKELVTPYLHDEAVTDSMTRVAYSHVVENVAISHIILPRNERALADSLHTRLMAGDDFAQLARKYSADRTCEKTGGYMGYISGGRLPVYAIEDAAFRMEPGQFSDVIPSRWGYHLIKVEAKRKAPGEVKARHILKLTNGLDAAAVAVKKTQIDSIYGLLKNGADFIEVASRETDDPSGKSNGGDLPWFGPGMMVPDFEKAAFSLSANELSEPVMSPFGYHIILCEGRRDVASFDELKDKLRDRVLSDDREEIIINRTLDKYMQQARSKIEWKSTGRVHGILEQCGGINDEARKRLTAAALTLFKIGHKVEKVTSADLALALEGVDIADPSAAAEVVDNHIKELVYAKAMDHFVATLPERESQYANLLNEYRDGLLLCEISNSKVWDRANKDHDGLQKCFLAHRDEFVWDKPHYKGYIIAAKSDSLADAALSYLNASDIDASELVSSLRKKFGTDVKIEKVIAGRGDNAVVDHLAFAGPEPNLSGRWTSYRAYAGQVLEQPSEAADIKGPVSQKYQQELEQAWLDELSSRYAVKVNGKVIDTLR